MMLSSRQRVAPGEDGHARRHHVPGGGLVQAKGPFRQLVFLRHHDAFLLTQFGQFAHLALLDRATLIARPVGPVARESPYRVQERTREPLEQQQNGRADQRQPNRPGLGHCPWHQLAGDQNRPDGHDRGDNHGARPATRRRPDPQPGGARVEHRVEEHVGVEEPIGLLPQARQLVGLLEAFVHEGADARIAHRDARGMGRGQQRRPDEQQKPEAQQDCRQLRAPVRGRPDADPTSTGRLRRRDGGSEALVLLGSTSTGGSPQAARE